MKKVRDFSVLISFSLRSVGCNNTFESQLKGAVSMYVCGYVCVFVCIKTLNIAYFGISQETVLGVWSNT